MPIQNLTTTEPWAWWLGDQATLAGDDDAIREHLRRITRPVFVVERDGALFVTHDGGCIPAATLGNHPGALKLRGILPPVALERLGDASFCADLGIRYPYICGSMAHGISSPAIAEALGKAGMLGFIGAAGQSPQNVEAAIDRMQSLQPAVPFGFNLIHSPNEPDLEAAIADLYLRRGIRLVEASAYLNVTLPLVKYRVSGIRREADGQIVTPNRVIGKISRVEVAAKFFAPPPAKLLQELVNRGDITPEQAELAAQIPIAQDLTAEADSGGHTDNRPAVTLLPTIIALRDQFQAQYRYPMPLRVGMGGGIATPASAAAALAMGAAYLVTGSVNQACIESGTSDAARRMLCQAGQADTAMAPAGDMFEMGVTVQVLKRGTMFAMRAAKLYEIFKANAGLHTIPAADRENLEKNVFKDTLENVWASTREFFLRRDPAQAERADRDPKHLMALVFRWYLGLSPRWAVTGDPARTVDYQIWCGPAMGAFNEWAKGSFFEQQANRRVVDVAHNLLFGAAVTGRAAALRAQGVPLPQQVTQTPPLPVDNIASYIQ
ncbi:MAG TPA: PfaD family polyunsaturated fatty acid/polyketide biosynthesis protein [Candidatus Ozemobacteraceae bacterium]|nr:PfaD family polyunsaturated fatty acid/polyketide biosynthesis protein [Candidatus Ozemobacteraceae bacterium]